MGSPKKLNLSTLYSSYIHVPTIKNSENKSPLYARIEYDEKSLESSSLNRDEAWNRATQTSYNSPTNIRRIIISGRKVVLNFWKPYIVKNKANTEGLWRIREIQGLQPLEVAKKQMEYTIRMMKSTDLAYNSGLNIEYTLSGSPLKSINQPWVLSNLEEIYIDPILLLTPDIMSRYGAENIIRSIMTSDMSILSKEKAQILSSVTGSSDISSLLKQLDRLKIFGVIPGIDRIIDLNNFSKQSDLTRDKRGLVEVWAEQGLVDINKCLTVITPLYNKVNMNKLSTRNYYRFDNEILTPYAEEQAAKLLAEARKIRDEKLAATRKEVEASKSDLEKMLDNIWDTEGANKTVAIIKLTFARSSKEERHQEYNKLTAEGKARYRAIIE